MRNLIIAVAIVLAFAGVAFARTITVGLGPGYDFNTIQAAIDNSNDGDVVLVAPGTYTGPGNRDINFLGKAITVRSSDPNDPNIVASTVIDCNGTKSEPHRGFYLNNNEDANSVLAGLTIINGYGHNEQFGTYTRVAGGGIFCGFASPTITKCRIQYNYAGAGGGICCRQNNTSIANCIITNNSSDNGGGIYCGTSTADTNSPKIDRCIISNNSATTRGGGIRCGDNSQITNCVITSNGGVNGGGVGFLYATTPLMTNSIIAGNTRYHGPLGDGGGSGVSIQHGSRAAVVNCTIVDNETAQYGGGIDVYISAPLVANCIIWNNTAEWGGNTIGRQIVVRGNFMTGDIADLTLRYCDIEGGLANIKLEYESKIGFAIGNTDTDPCFVDPNSGNYHLLLTSPCIDTGDPNYIPEPNETDLDGNPRVMGPAIDMGAYEYRPTIPAEVNIEPNTLNLQSKGNWLTCHIWLPEDYNVTDIDPNSVFLENIIAAEMFEINNDVAIVKFNRSEVQSILIIGENKLAITGELLDGTIFEGTDIISVIDKGGKKK